MLLTATLYAIGLALVYFAYRALVAIIFSLFFAYVLEPTVKLFEARVWRSRLCAIAVSYIIFAVVFAGLALLLEQRLGRELRNLEQKGPAYWADIRTGQVPPEIAAHSEFASKVERSLTRWISENQSQIEQWAHRSMEYSTDVAAIPFWTVVVLILAVFVLKDKDRWVARLSREPDEPGKRRRVRSMLIEIDRAMARYIWSLLTLSAMAFVVFALVLRGLHLPFALLLAALQALMELIFVFGPLIAAVIILTASMLSGHSLLPTVGFLIAWRILQDYVNAPLLFGRRLEMHPLAVVVILMIGWSIGNVLGMFLSVPIAAAGQIGWSSWTTNASPAKDVAAVFENSKAA